MRSRPPRPTKGSFEIRLGKEPSLKATDDGLRVVPWAMPWISGFRILAPLASVATLIGTAASHWPKIREFLSGLTG